MNAFFTDALLTPNTLPISDKFLMLANISIAAVTSHLFLPHRKSAVGKPLRLNATTIQFGTTPIFSPISIKDAPDSRSAIAALISHFNPIKWWRWWSLADINSKLEGLLLRPFPSLWCTYSLVDNFLPIISAITIRCSSLCRIFPSSHRTQIKRYGVELPGNKRMWPPVKLLRCFCMMLSVVATNLYDCLVQNSINVAYVKQNRCY